MLEYRPSPVIINDSLSKRTMKVAKFRFPLVSFESARWTMVFKLRYRYKRISQVAVNEEGRFGNP